MSTINNNVNAFKDVYDSFNLQEKHGYLVFDSKTKTLSVSRPGEKGKAASFEEVSRIAQELLQNKDLSTKEKRVIVQSFQLIERKFEDKKLGFFRRLFFQNHKIRLIESARDIIIEAKEQIAYEERSELEKVSGMAKSKFAQRQASPSLTGQFEEVLNFKEARALKVLFPLDYQGSEIDAAVTDLKAKTVGFISADIKAIKEKAARGELTASEIEGIIEAKRLRVELTNTVGSYLNIESFRAEDEGVNRLYELSALQSSQIDDALYQHYKGTHQNKFSSSSSNSILIEGAGPTGLMAAFKLYMEGGQVALVNNRGELYQRGQILRLDPKWVSELHYYLGAEFSDMLEKGYALLKPSGYVEFSINILEDAIKGRLARIWSREEAEGTNHLDLQYDIELKNIENKLENFQANLGPRGKETINSHRKFDVLICAGGGNDSIRNEYLSPAVRKTEEVDYTTSVWKRNEVDLNIEKYSKKEDFRGFLMQEKSPLNQFSAILNKIVDESDLNAAHRHFISGLQHEIEAISNKEIVYRFFENPRQLYLGLQYPQELSALIKKLKNIAKGDEDSEKAMEAVLKKIHKTIQIESYKQLGVNIEAIAEEESLNAFPVSVSATSTQAKVLDTYHEKLALISVVGDALVAPHFFTASGLSTGRQGTNHLVSNFAENIQGKGNFHLYQAVDDINSKQKGLINLAIARAQPFTPEITDLNVANTIARDKQRDLLDAHIGKQLPFGAQLKKIDSFNDFYSLTVNSHTITFLITEKGKLLSFHTGEEYDVLNDLNQSFIYMGNPIASVHVSPFV